MCFASNSLKPLSARKCAARDGLSHRVPTLNLGSFPLTVIVTTMGYRSYKNLLSKAPLRTVTGREWPNLNPKTLNPKP